VRPFLIAFSLTLSASIALSQTSIEQPVASPIYGAAAGDQFAPVVASNGSGFLVTWNDQRSLPATLYATRVSADGQVLDGTGIRIPIGATNAYVNILGAFWVGNAYAIVYAFGGTSVVRISDRGEVIDGPRVVTDFAGAAAASNGSRIVIAGGNTVAVLDDQAQLVGQSTLSPKFLYAPTIASNGSNFLLSTVANDGFTNWVYFVLVDANGRAVSFPRLAAATVGARPVVATDGVDYLVLYRDAVSRDVAQRVTADGAVGSSAILTGISPSILSRALIWTGDRYLLAGAGSDPQQSMIVAALDRAGNTIAGVSSLKAPGTPGVVNVPSLAIAGSNVWVAWTTGDQSAPNGLDVAGMLLNTMGQPLSDAMVLATSSNPQGAPAIGTGASRDLVAWEEPSGFYVARLSSDGSAIDGRGIQISDETIASDELVEAPRLSQPPETRVVHDGDAYLVAWTSRDRKLSAQLVDAETGALLGQRLVLAPCVNSFDLERDKTGDVVFASDCSNILFAQRVGSAGAIGGPVVISPPQTATSNPRAASNGTEWLVAWNELILIPTLGPVPLYRHNVRAQRVSPALTIIDSDPIAIDTTAYEADNPVVATNGDEFIVAWSRFTDPAGVYARRINAAGTFGDRSPSPGIGVVPGSARALAVVWDGSRYAVEYTAARADGVNQLRLSHLVDDRPVDAIAISREDSDTLEADLAISSTGQLNTVYARTAPEPVYGGVTRVFTVDIFGSRQRPFRRR
jgi:hypothetical protein